MKLETYVYNPEEALWYGPFRRTPWWQRILGHPKFRRTIMFNQRRNHINYPGNFYGYEYLG